MLQPSGILVFSSNTTEYLHLHPIGQLRTLRPTLFQFFPDLLDQSSLLVLFPCQISGLLKRVQVKTRSAQRLVTPHRPG